MWIRGCFSEIKTMCYKTQQRTVLMQNYEMKIYKLFCLFFIKTIDNSPLLRDELLYMLPDMFCIRNIVIT